MLDNNFVKEINATNSVFKFSPDIWGRVLRLDVPTDFPHRRLQGKEPSGGVSNNDEELLRVK